MAMMTTFKCPECDAALDVASGTSIVRCKFCGASVDVRAAAARAAVSTQRAQTSRGAMDAVERPRRHSSPWP